MANAKSDVNNVDQRVPNGLNDKENGTFSKEGKNVFPTLFLL